MSTHRGLSFELYSIDRDSGTVQPLTDLASQLPEVYIQSYSWSPDGQSIAFWLNSSPMSDQDFGEQQLVVLDSTKHTMTNYCVPGDYGTTRQARVPPPLWSPDGRQLVVENRYAEDASRVILVDLGQKYAAVIAEDMEPVGWLTTQP